MLAELASRVDQPEFLGKWRGAIQSRLKDVLLRHERYFSLEVTDQPRFKQFLNRRIRDLTLPDGCLVALIRRDGEIVQYVPFQHRAWHAGASAYRNRHRCNDFSIGIELEGTDHLPYDERQYPILATLITTLRATYLTIAPERLAGHADIAPGRKTDPGPAFDWARLRRLLGDAG